MKRLLLLTAIFLTACSPSIQEEEEVAIIDEIDQLVLVEKARAELLIKTETIKAVNNPLLP
jgi:archaeosine-15-forming tRNA-guanine transglycosylase|tara:strand:+ start:2251 stop:2433 length:183 start_codon:yes stop_codon:yes gene_type:complete